MFEAPDGGEGKLSTLCLAGKQPCLSTKTSRYPGRLLLPRHRRGPVSRHGAGSGHRRRGPAQQRPPAMGHGQANGPARGDLLPARTSDAQHRSHRPRRRSRRATPPGVGLAIANHRQAGRTTGPTPEGAGVRTKAPETVASKPHFHIPTGVPQLEPDHFHPYPRAPAPLPG